MNSNNIIKIYCAVRYENKDEAKSHGAKWNVEEKRWYFMYQLEEFLNNDSLHTYSYKPYRLDYIKCEFSKITDQPVHRYKDIIYKTLMERYNNYCSTIETPFIN